MGVRRWMAAVTVLAALVGVTLTWLASPAYAIDARQVTTTIAARQTNWDDTLVVPRLDPSVGVLQQVELQLVASSYTDVAVENVGASPDQLELTLGGRLELDVPLELQALGFPRSMTADQSRILELAAFDGSADFEGPSGRSLDGVASSKTYHATYDDPTMLGIFVGSEALHLPASAVATTLAIGGGNRNEQFRTSFGVELTIRLTYLQSGVSVSKTALTPTIPAGGDARFAIRVSNTGDTTLGNIIVSDPAAPDCDRLIAELAPGVVDEYECTMPAVAAPPDTPPTEVPTVTNTVNVTGQGGTQIVTSTDDADVLVGTAGVAVTKLPASQTVPAGGDATFTITITNSGTVPLTEVSLEDPAAPDCAGPVGPLAVGASTTVHCVLAGVTAPMVNIVDVHAASAVGPATARAEAAVAVAALVPSVALEASINGVDAGAAPGPAIEVGGNATLSVLVTNTGDDVLSAVSVVDDVAGPLACPAATLAVGASMTCGPITEAVDATTTVAHTVTVSATGSAGGSVTASDVAVYHGTRTALCPATAGLLRGLRFQVDGGPAVASLGSLVARPGDTITVTWDGFAPGSEDCLVSLAQHATDSLQFDQLVEQPLVASVSCVDGGCRVAVGYRMELVVVDSGGPNQFDLVTGRPKASVGPSGGFYSSILGAAVNRLISHGTSPGA